MKIYLNLEAIQAKRSQFAGYLDGSGNVIVKNNKKVNVVTYFRYKCVKFLNGGVDCILSARK